MSCSIICLQRTCKMWILCKACIFRLKFCSPNFIAGYSLNVVYDMLLENNTVPICIAGCCTEVQGEKASDEALQWVGWKSMYLNHSWASKNVELLAEWFFRRAHLWKIYAHQNKSPPLLQIGQTLRFVTCRTLEFFMILFSVFFNNIMLGQILWSLNFDKKGGFSFIGLVPS